MTYDREENESDESGVSIDVYGVKLKNVRPGEIGETPPESWREVLERLNGHLMRLAVAPTRLLAEVFEGGTRLLNGLTSLPGAMATRLREGHARADRAEAERQSALASSGDAATAPERQHLPSAAVGNNARELLDRLSAAVTAS